MTSQTKFPSKLLRFQYISLWMLVICNICIHDYLLIASRVIVKITVWISLFGKTMKDLLLMGNIPLGTIFWFWYKRRILVALTRHLNIICLMVHIPMIFLFITHLSHCLKHKSYSFATFDGSITFCLVKSHWWLDHNPRTALLWRGIFGVALGWTRLAAIWVVFMGLVPGRPVEWVRFPSGTP
jgi:hypothetical protein